MSDLTITLIQSDLCWENVESNLEYFSKRLVSVSSDLIVLPEMFTTGFSMQTSLISTNQNQQILEWMSSLAAEKDAVISGSTIWKHRDQYVNRFLFVYPDGQHEHYDKRHLFSMGKEDQHFVPGQTRKIIKVKDWNILPQICYDLRFSESANHEGSADLILYTASWPTPRIQHWDALLQARAIENLSYVAAVNRIGIDGHGVQFSGHTQVLHPMGYILTKSVNAESNLECKLVKEELRDVRAKLPFLEDKV